MKHMCLYKLNNSFVNNLIKLDWILTKKMLNPEKEAETIVI